MQNSTIEWTDTTWNPVRGCSRISEGCRNCYAETIANRFKGEGQPYEGLTTNGGQWNGNIKLLPEKLLEPWRMVKPRRIFVNSTSDLFHADVPFEFIAAVFWVMSVTTRHTYQILTKRPYRMLEFFRWLNDGVPHFDDEVAPFVMASELGEQAARLPVLENLPWQPCTKTRGGYDNCGPAFPPKNVWLGVSVEDQTAAEHRIPPLLNTPAAKRFISAEPLLGAADLTNLSYGGWPMDCLRVTTQNTVSDNAPINTVDWVIAGGESGPKARPMHPFWVRALRDQCQAAGTPFFFKQWGEWAPRAGELTGGGTAFDKLDPGCERWPDVIRLGEHGKNTRICENCGPDAGEDVFVQRVGKKLAGRTLDGREWNEFPEA